jgi:hypothetical protein
MSVYWVPGDELGKAFRKLLPIYPKQTNMARAFYAWWPGNPVIRRDEYWIRIPPDQATDSPLMQLLVFQFAWRPQ